VNSTRLSKTDVMILHDVTIRVVFPSIVMYGAASPPCSAYHLLAGDLAPPTCVPLRAAPTSPSSDVTSVQVVIVASSAALPPDQLVPLMSYGVNPQQTQTWAQQTPSAESFPPDPLLVPYPSYPEEAVVFPSRPS